MRTGCITLAATRGGLKDNSRVLQLSIQRGSLDLVRVLLLILERAIVRRNLTAFLAISSIFGSF